MSLIRKVYSGQKVGSSERVSISESQMESLLSVRDDPNPRDFERLVPWVFRQFGFVNIKTKRFDKAEYQPVAMKKVKKPLKNASVVAGTNQNLDKKDFVASKSAKEFMRELSTSINWADQVVISAYYDTNGDLVEIAIIDCLVPVPNEMFLIIQLLLPYYPQLRRITWKGDSLTGTLVHEMSKMIPESEITDLIFDGCIVPQGNYYLLLDKATKLKYLSLTNCKINDEACVMIAERIQRNHPAAENLLVLNLSSNNITDVGAEALGRSLRTNRRLLYLNLCNNDITSVGAAHILSPLTKFKLSLDENRDILFLKLKSLQEARNINVNFEIKEQKSKLKKNAKSKNNETQMSDNSDAAIGDIFLATIKKDKKGSWYSSGNLTFCALNLAYNRLDSATVSRIVDVVSYQYRKRKSTKTDGLLRVVIEGNPLPDTCMEYDLINKYIDLAIRHSTPQGHSMYLNLTRSKTKMSDTALNKE